MSQALNITEFVTIRCELAIVSRLKQVDHCYGRIQEPCQRNRTEQFLLHQGLASSRGKAGSGAKSNAAASCE